MFNVLSIMVAATLVSTGMGVRDGVAKSCCEEPGAVVEAYFERISGGPGPREWSQINALLLPDTRFSAIGVDAKGESELLIQSSQEYLHHLGDYVKTRGFHQSETCRSEYRFGRLATVVSTYESRNRIEAAVIDRGVIAFHLLSDGSRWFIANVTWHSQTRATPLSPAAKPPGCKPVGRGGAG